LQRLNTDPKLPGQELDVPLNGRPHAPATFVISLDFELHWGVRDVKGMAQYRQNLLGVRRVVPAILATFAEYGVHATWATVGFLFFRTRAELLASLPDLRPSYDDLRLSPYLDMKVLGRDEDDDPFHFGRTLIDQIRSNSGQEIATHTFSHYFCLEPRQNLAAFRADLQAAIAAAANLGITLNSIAFPRNQYGLGYLDVCRRMGLKAFRGNQNSRLYQPRATARETRWLRAARLVDSYWDLSSHNSYPLADMGREPLLNLRASRFLRPYVPYMPALQALQEKRILSDMTYAAERGFVYHLWWHPHNFGAHLEQNMGALRRILDHFQIMRERCGMQSMNMAECVPTAEFVRVTGSR
jgi:peptidoglycan/xylan/chitin deacetylase (PgdA/CDA1 family)